MNEDTILKETDSETSLEQSSPSTETNPLQEYLILTVLLILPFCWGGYIGYMYAPEKIVERAVEVEKIAVSNVGDSQEFEWQPAPEAVSSVEGYTPIGYNFFRKGPQIFYSITTYELDEDNVEQVSDVVYIPIYGADVETFEVFEGHAQYAKDKNSVYMRIQPAWSSESDHKVVRIEKADPQTFEVKIVEEFPVSQGNTYRSWISRDVNHVYYQDQIIDGADPASFMLTDHVSLNFDINNVYLWYKILPDADPSTYEVVIDTSAAGRGVVFGKDADNCYKDYEILSCSDMPKTYQEAYDLVKDQ